MGRKSSRLKSKRSKGVASEVKAEISGYGVGSWFLSPSVMLQDLYKDEALCQKYNLKSASPLKVKWYHCRGCVQVFQSSTLLKAHCLAQHSYRCDVCGFEDTNQLSMDAHMDSLHINPEGKCVKCSIEVAGVAEFRRHMLGHILISPKIETKELKEPKDVKKEVLEMPIIEWVSKGGQGPPELVVISDSEDELTPEAPAKKDKIDPKTIKSSELSSVLEKKGFRVKTSCRCRTCEAFFPSIMEAYHHLKSEHLGDIPRENNVMGKVKLKVKIIKVNQHKKSAASSKGAAKPKTITKKKPKILIDPASLFGRPKGAPVVKPSTSNSRKTLELDTKKPSEAAGKVLKASEVLQLLPKNLDKANKTTDFITETVKVKRENSPKLIEIPEFLEPPSLLEPAEEARVPPPEPPSDIPKLPIPPTQIQNNSPTETRDLSPPPLTRVDSPGTKEHPSLRQLLETRFKEPPVLSPQTIRPPFRSPPEPPPNQPQMSTLKIVSVSSGEELVNNQIFTTTPASSASASNRKRRRPVVSDVITIDDDEDEVDSKDHQLLNRKNLAWDATSPLGGSAKRKLLKNQSMYQVFEL